MRRCLLLAAALAIAGCQTTPVSYFSTTPQPIGDAYSCALRKVNELGYTVTNTNREAGFITADKQTTGMFTKAFTGSEYHDVITVSVFDDPASGGRKIRVTAGTSDHQSSLLGTSSNNIAPSDKGQKDASTILSTCGEGPVTKQSSLAPQAAIYERAGM